MATKRKPPKVIPLPLEKSIADYYEAKLTVFEFESTEALSDQDWKRLKAIFQDFGTFLVRHPRSVNDDIISLPDARPTG